MHFHLVKYFGKYQKRNPIFRDGELLINQGFAQTNGYGKYSQELSKLTAADFDRAQALADKFQRSDAQIIARLIIAQSVLTGKIGLVGGAGEINGEFGDGNGFVAFSN